ncbi:MAG: hypothetical protein E3J70_07715 [Candidatus Heimdallarchaeota archaeon]|nr:MAG: hypothetical protein E3J70_07715 [Candidatus Heimdallarchaeota archaeon]
MVINRIMLVLVIVTFIFCQLCFPDEIKITNKIFRIEDYILIRDNFEIKIPISNSSKIIPLPHEKGFIEAQYRDHAGPFISYINIYNIKGFLRGSFWRYHSEHTANQEKRGNLPFIDRIEVSPNGEYFIAYYGYEGVDPVIYFYRIFSDTFIGIPLDEFVKDISWSYKFDFIEEGSKVIFFASQTYHYQGQDEIIPPLIAIFNDAGEIEYQCTSFSELKVDALKGILEKEKPEEIFAKIEDYLKEFDNRSKFIEEHFPQNK